MILKIVFSTFLPKSCCWLPFLTLSGCWFDWSMDKTAVLSVLVVLEVVSLGKISNIELVPSVRKM